MIHARYDAWFIVRRPIKRTQLKQVHVSCRRGHDVDIMSIETGSTKFLGGFMIPTFDVYSELQDCCSIPAKLRCSRCAKR